MPPLEALILAFLVSVVIFGASLIWVARTMNRPIKRRRGAHGPRP